VPGTSTSSLAKLGSSAGMSQPPPGTILLHVGMRDMVTRAVCAGRSVTSAPRRAASRSILGRLPLPRISAGHAWHSPSPAWPGSPASRRGWWLKAWDGVSAPDQVPGAVSPARSKRCRAGWAAREGGSVAVVLDEEQAVDGLDLVWLGPPGVLVPAS
jgi:hypothetical protein